MDHFGHDHERNGECVERVFSHRSAVEAVRQFGLLDESFFMYGEDLDWSRRCWDSGWQVRFYPQALAIHHQESSSRSNPIRFAIQLECSVCHYWSKHHYLPARLLNRLLLSLKHFSRSIFWAGEFLLKPEGRRSISPPQPSSLLTLPASGCCGFRHLKKFGDFDWSFNPPAHKKKKGLS